MPTPGFTERDGVVFWSLRHRDRMTRSISEAQPIMGSSLTGPQASWVMSRPESLKRGSLGFLLPGIGGGRKVRPSGWQGDSFSSSSSSSSGMIVVFIRVHLVFGGSARPAVRAAPSPKSTPNAKFIFTIVYFCVFLRKWHTIKNCFVCTRIY